MNMPATKTNTYGTIQLRAVLVLSLSLVVVLTSSRMSSSFDSIGIAGFAAATRDRCVSCFQHSLTFLKNRASCHMTWVLVSLIQFIWILSIVVVVVVNILFQTKKTTLMIGHCAFGTIANSFRIFCVWR